MFICNVDIVLIHLICYKVCFRRILFLRSSAWSSVHAKIQWQVSFLRGTMARSNGFPLR